MTAKSGNCILCNVFRKSLHRDHIIPKFKGGTNDESNIQYICANCHEDKTREDLKGYAGTKEQREKRIMSLRTFLETHPHPMLGKHHSEETRKRMSAAQLGRVSGMKGKHHSVETRRKISTAKLGKPHSTVLKGRPWSAKRRAAQERKSICL